MNELSRRWQRVWVQPRFAGPATAYTLEQEWTVRGSTGCEECYYDDEFTADSREGLIAKLEEHFVEERERIRRLIAELRDMPDLGTPDDHLLVPDETRARPWPELVSSGTEHGWRKENNDG